VIYSHGGNIFSTGQAPAAAAASQTRQATFQQYLLVENAASWRCHNLAFSGDVTKLAQSLRDGSAIAVSDGSYKSTYGTASWWIEAQGSSISGDALVPGLGDAQSSYRSELTGLYAILDVCHYLCSYLNILEGGITIGCDGLEALRKSFAYKLHFEDPCFDLLAAIHRMRTTSPLCWTFQHVKGHQDSFGSELDHWAQLNILMDARAKRFLTTAFSVPRFQTFWQEPWSLWIDGKKVTNKFTPTVYSLVQDQRAVTYWGQKADLCSDDFPVVDWHSIGTAIREIPRSRRVFLSKHLSGMCGVGKFMLRWKEWDHDRCPRCGSSEDSAHIWLCSGS